MTVMELDEMLQTYVGGIDIYQIVMLMYISSLALQVAFNNVDFNFIGFIPDFHCDVGNIDHLKSNLTFKELQQLTSPLVKDKLDTCHVFQRNYSSLTVADAHDLIQDVNNTDTVRACSNFVFNNEDNLDTIVSEWGLVCDKEWLIATAQSVYMAGQCTQLIGGTLSDRLVYLYNMKSLRSLCGFGRRALTIAMVCILVVSRAACALSPNYYMFLVARFVMGGASSNTYVLIFVLAIEMVTPKYRATAGQSPYYTFSVGVVITAAIAYYMRSWRWLTGIFILFAIPYVTYICLLPESMRWLQAKNRTDEANEGVRRMAKRSKKSIPEDVTLSKKVEDDSKVRIIDLFKNKDIIITVLILLFNWVAENIVYYGMLLYLVTLGGNIYFSTMMTGALEIPALFYVQMTYHTNIGRRINASVFAFLTGICLLVLMFIPKNLNWLVITLALIGKLGCTITYAVVYLLTPEVLPTLYRSVGVSVFATSARIGGIVAPYIALSGSISTYIPPTIFGVLSLLVGIVTIFLREAKNNPLPQSFSDVVDQLHAKTPPSEGNTEKEVLHNNDTKV